MKLGPNLTGNLAMCQIIDPDGHKPGDGHLVSRVMQRSQCLKGGKRLPVNDGPLRLSQKGWDVIGRTDYCGRST